MMLISSKGIYPKNQEIYPKNIPQKPSISIFELVLFEKEA